MSIDNKIIMIKIHLHPKVLIESGGGLIKFSKLWLRASFLLQVVNIRHFLSAIAFFIVSMQVMELMLLKFV